MSNIKKFRGNFVTTSRQVAQDERISWKARGIFLYLASMSDEWNFYVDEVAKHSPQGKRALQAGLKELEEFGYLVRVQKHSEDGNFSQFDWELHYEPVSRQTQNRVNAKMRQTQNVPLINNNSNKEQLTINNNNNNSSSARDSLDTNTKYIDSKSNNAFELYQIHVGMLSGTQTPIFIDYVQKLGDEVVQYAINLMLDQTSRPNFKYLQKILMKYENLNVHSVDEAKEIEKQYTEQAEKRSQRFQRNTKKVEKKNDFDFG